ncbi:MAG: hypothetical protein ABSA57_09820 [Candidatus Acidiferrales bacterium]|jgi:hypothetical protein
MIHPPLDDNSPGERPISEFRQQASLAEAKTKTALGERHNHPMMQQQALQWKGYPASQGSLMLVSQQDLLVANLHVRFHKEQLQRRTCLIRRPVKWNGCNSGW